MKRYLLTSPKFTGNMELIYLDGRIVRADLMEADVTDEQKLYLFRHIPLIEAELEKMVSGTGLTCIEADYEITLDDFTREYPYKRNTHLLAPIWAKMSKSDQVMAWIKAREYRKHCERNNGWYKPKIAAAWLKNKEYLNDWKNL